jgi:hypothetical protein
MPLRNMMQNLLNVMPDLKHCVETLPQKKGPGSMSQHYHNFPRSYGERAWRNLCKWGLDGTEVVLFADSCF